MSILVISGTPRKTGGLELPLLISEIGFIPILLI